jgi:hypothetical protein
MSKEQARIDSEFRRIVEDNHFQEDILVPVLADNALVRHTVKTLPFLYERSEGEECLDELGNFLVSCYGLSPEFTREVFGLCQDNLRYGRECEMWVGPYDNIGE